LIRRSAIERMIAAYPETHFKSVHSMPMSGTRSDVVQSSNLYALFDCIIDAETGAYLSEDYSFCFTVAEDLVGRYGLMGRVS